MVILRLLRLAVGTLGVFSALLVEPTVEETAPRRLPGPEARLLWLLLLTMASELRNVGTGPPRRQATCAPPSGVGTLHRRLERVALLCWLGLVVAALVEAGRVLLLLAVPRRRVR